MSSSPVAVAASDPGGDSGHGEPKQELQPEAADAAGASSGDAERSSAGGSGPAGDTDVTMTEAAEEVAAVAEVKVEGAVVAGDAAVTADVVREGSDAAAASDSMYATESAGMVSEERCGDESVDEARDVVQEGGDAVVAIDPLYATESAGMVSVEGHGDESVNEARGLDGGDSGERLEAEAGALTGEAERKPVPAGDVAVAGEVVEAPGSATIEHAKAESNELEEDYVNATPAVGNDGKDNGVAHCDKEIQNGPANFDQCARYCLPPLDKDGFRVSDLVWGKVKSHPWWPGEIFDPSDASELALKHQKKGNRLVAYFGDNSFAWCDESQLKPFVTNYSQMEKQSSSDAFVSSVNYALEELSRRILSGMSCSCLPEELSDNGMSYMVENAGLKDGVTCSEVNRSEILTCFSPESLLHYIKSLALFPGQGGDLLELVIACSQLTSFYRSKGCPELASFQTGSAWAENGMDTSSAKNVMVEEAVTSEVHPSDDKPKRGRGRPRKQKPEDDLELMGKKATSSLSKDTAYDVPLRRRMVRDFDDFDDLQNKKKRSLDSFEDSETKSSTPTFGSSFKIGECIRRAASQLAGSSSIVKSHNEPTVYKNTAQAENAEFDISSDDAVNELTVEKRAKRRRMHRHHIADPNELLSQLCSVAMEPMNRYNSSAMIISYFSDYRNYVVSTTTEASIVEKSTAKRGRKRRVLPSPELETTDHMQDSYWSGLSLHNHPIHSLKRATANTRPRRRRKSSQETDVPSVQQLQTLGPKKQIQVIERSIIHVDEKMVDECNPTALVLSFGRSSALPSETDLIKMFGRYGPLKESETEVQKNTNTVKIVFKRRADAERAFSVAGKYGTFGPSLRSYRLVNMPFSLGLSEANNPEARPGDHDLEVPGPSESEVSLDTVQVDQVDKIGKAEAVKESPGEQVETIKQTCPAEAAHKVLVEKTGQIGAELTGRSDQIGTAAHSGQAENIAEESSEQVSMIEHAYTQDEASLNDQSEIVLSGAATGASNGGTFDEIQLGKAPNQASLDVPSNTLQMEAVAEAQTEDTIKQASYAEAINKVSAEILSDAIQVDVVAKAPKQGHVCGDNDVFEAVGEASIIAQVDTVEQTVEEASAEVRETAMPAVTVPEALQGGHVLSDDLHPEVQTEEALQVVGVIEQARKELIAQVDTVEQTVQEASAEVRATVMPAVTVPEALQGGHVLSDELHPEVQTEEALQVVGVIEQARKEPLDENAKDVTEAGTENEVPEETRVSLELQAQRLIEKTVEQDAIEQIMEFQAPKEVPEGTRVSLELQAQRLIEKTAEQDATEQVMEFQAPKEVPEGTRVSLELQAQRLSEKTVEQDATEQVMEFQAPKEVSAEIPRDAKLEVKVLTEEPVGQVTTEQVKGPMEESATVLSDTVPVDSSEVQGSEVQSQTVQFQAVCETSVQQEGTNAADTVEDLTIASAQEAGSNKRIVESKTLVEVSAKQVCIVEQTVQVGDIAEASGGQTDVGKQTAEDVAMAEVMVERAVESKVEAPVEEIVENEAAAETPGEETTAEAPDDKMENKAAGEALPGEIGEGESTAHEQDEGTYKANAEALAGETIEGETTAAPHVETATAEKIADGATVEAPNEQNTNAENIVEDAMVEAPDEKATTAEKTIEDVTVEAPGEKAATAEKTVEDATDEAPDEKATIAEKTVEDAPVEAPGEIAAIAEKTIEDAPVEAPGEIAATAEKTVEDATVEAPDEKATTAEKTVEGATIEAPSEIAATAEKTVEDATVEAPGEIAATAEKTVEDATVEAPDEKATTDEKTVEDAPVEAPGEIVATAEKIIEEATVEVPDEKATLAKNPVEGATIEAPGEKTVEDAIVEAQDEKAKTAEKTVEDATVEAPGEIAATAEKTVEDATVKAPDEKATTAEKTVKDTTLEAPDEIATTVEKTVEDATVKAPDEKTTIAEEGATVKAADGQAGVTEQTD